MTCIVGIAQGGKVYLGGDSAGVGGWEVTHRADLKVFKNGPMVMGFTSSFRMGQLLQHKLVVPARSAESIEQFLAVTFVDALRECLAGGGWLAKEHVSREDAGTFLLGYAGRLFRVCDDFQIAESLDGFDAVGCGAPYALGALRGLKGTPAKRLTAALETSAHFSIGVRAPFNFVIGGDA